MRISLFLGNLISVSGLLTGFALLKFENLFAYFISWFCFWYFSHCLAHYLVGKIFGIKFSYYFVGKSNLVRAIKILQKLRFPVLGIKFDRESVRSRRAAYAMFSAGVLASNLMSFIVPVYLFLSSNHFWILFTLLSFSNLILTAFLSPRYGDLAKASKFAAEKFGRN